MLSHVKPMIKVWKRFEQVAMSNVQNPNTSTCDHIWTHAEICGFYTSDVATFSNKDSQQRISILKKIKIAFAICRSRQSAKKFCYKKNKKSLCRLTRGSRQTRCAPSSHNGIRSLCRLPYWQVAKALPTAFHLASGKGFFADKFFATCSLPTATCKAVGKAFTTCFGAF